MATTEHTSATALTQQPRFLTPAQIAEVKTVHERMVYVAEGLQGLGVMISAEEMSDWGRENIGHAIFALGQYAQDLNNRLEGIASHSFGGDHDEYQH
jgi:hypothetical protein